MLKKKIQDVEVQNKVQKEVRRRQIPQRYPYHTEWGRTRGKGGIGRTEPERVQCDKGSEEDTLKREEVGHSPAYFRENGGGYE